MRVKLITVFDDGPFTGIDELHDALAQGWRIVFVSAFPGTSYISNKLIYTLVKSP